MLRIKLALIKSKLNSLDKQIAKAERSGNFAKVARLENKQWELSDKMDDIIYQLQFGKGK